MQHIILTLVSTVTATSGFFSEGTGRVSTVRSVAGSTSGTGAICSPGSVGATPLSVGATPLSVGATPLSVVSSVAAAIRPTLIEANCEINLVRKRKRKLQKGTKAYTVHVSYTYLITHMYNINYHHTATEHLPYCNQYLILYTYSQGRGGLKLANVSSSTLCSSIDPMQCSPTTGLRPNAL